MKHDLEEKDHEELKPQNVLSATCLRTPCLLEGEKIIAFVDAGSTSSFVNRAWVEKHDIPIVPQGGKIIQILSKSEEPRIGIVEGLTLENGTKKIKVNLEVGELSGEEELVIGMDLFQPLGYELLNVPFTWPNRAEVPEPPKEKMKEPVNRPPGVDENGIAEEWKQVLSDNAAIPTTSLCKLPGAEFEIDTGDAKPIWTHQYPIAEALKPRVSAHQNF